MFAIEQGFGIPFSGNELGEFQDTGGLKRYLERRRRT
jgi:hypothetical protein